MSRQPRVLVVDDDAGLLRLLADRHERLRIRRSDDDGVHSLGNHLFHKIDLSGNVQFVLNAVGDQFVMVGVRLLMGLGPVLHGQKELVRQGLATNRPGLCDYH